MFGSYIGRQRISTLFSSTISKTSSSKIHPLYNIATNNKSTTRKASMSAATSGELQIERVYCLSDNYSWILHDQASGLTAVVDPAEVSPVVEALRKHGWNLTHILNTHHHADHTGGNKALKTKYNAVVVGASIDSERIPGIDVELKDGETYKFGNTECICYETPGHTSGHISFYFPGSKALFPGDTLFSLGCGRLFEGSPSQMWNSLSKFLSLPIDTRVYCAHEYTQSNARFAISVDPENKDLQEFKNRIDSARAKNEPTVPSLLDEELKSNPFLRPDATAIRQHLNIPLEASNEEAFAAIRAAKDRFRGGASSLSTARTYLRMGWGLGKQKILDAFL